MTVFADCKAFAATSVLTARGRTAPLHSLIMIDLRRIALASALLASVTMSSFSTVSATLLAAHLHKITGHKTQRTLPCHVFYMHF